MRYLFTWLSSFLLFPLVHMAQPIGSWQEHLPFNQVTSLAPAGGLLYAATPYAVFSLAYPDQAITRYTRVSGLSETGVAAIGVMEGGGLLIAYQNSNIDILESDGVVNINALKLKPVSGDKTVYHVFPDGGRCLLSTGFAVVVVNLEKNEIGDTWVLGNGGQYTKVYALTRDGAFYYAATEEGLKRAPVSGRNLADYRSWELLPLSGGLQAGAVQQVMAAEGRIYVRQGAVLSEWRDGSFSPFYTAAGNLLRMDYSGGRLFVCIAGGAGAEVLEIGSSGGLVRTISGPALQAPGSVAIWQGSTWVGDGESGLLEVSGQELITVRVNAPGGIGSGDISARQGNWWISTGASVSHYREGNWTVYNAKEQTLPTGFTGIGPLVTDRGGLLWAGSAGSGLLRMNGPETTVFRAPLLEPALAGPGSFRVGGLATDEGNNLWITNDGAENGLVVRMADGNIYRFRVPFFYAGNTLGQVLVDEPGQKWLVSPGGNGLFCFNHGTSISNAGDDRWKYYRAGQGNGNLPSSNVLSIARDAFGFIWVGTDNGIGIIQCPGEVFSAQGCEAILPVVQTDNFAGYLFSGEAVQAIAVDGANRKWIGTRNGAWLISAGGEKTQLRFTSSNSPLPDNDVRKISVEPETGTVIFSTAKGIVSYRSDATEGGNTNTNVKVYPNPVPPGFNGPVAIRGLVNNAIVKITELNGRLVFQGRALGGQAIWNGLDLNGRRVSTGVYLVLASDETGREQYITKIVFIRQQP